MIPERGPRLLAAEGSLLAVSLVVALGFNRLFSEGGWFLSLASTVIAAHVLGGIARRLGLGVWLQLVAVGIATLLLMAWMQAPDTLRWFLPTTDTLAAFGNALDEALTLYPEARAPTAPITGFVLAAMFGLAIVASMADIAAFRLGAELQALVPPLTLFLFCSLLGSGEYRVVAAVTFIAVALTFVLLMRALGRRSATTWLPGDDQRGPSTLIRVGTSLTAIAALGAAIVAPGLPGADDEGLWTWRGGGGNATRFVISPLIDIRSRLVNQSSEIAFVVESPQPSYWRMLSLDEFEGDQFRLSTSFRAISRGLSPPGPGVTDLTVVEQRFTIEGLASPYLPAAFQPISVDTGREQVRWDDRSATLLLDASEPPRGFEYVVESVLPDLDPDRLRAAPDTVLPSIRERYLQLPDDFDPRVADLADAIVEGAATPYDRALLLQNHLRSEYAYSLSVPAGHSESALGRFLFVDQAGYCEQFSAAFAAMARQVGLPSRVAVGFTVGEQMRGSPTRYTVRGEHAHAWPEVWFNGIGWVAFEPTPGRGDPQTQGHTGVEPNQVGDEPNGTTTTSTVTTQPGDVPFPDLGDMIPDFETDPGATGGGGPSGSAGLPRAVIWLLVAAGAVAGWVALIWASATGVRVWRRRRAGDDRSARILVAWDELVAAAASLRLRPDPTETHREFARRVSRKCSTHPDLVPLAAEVAAARFGPSTYAQEDEPVLDDELQELLDRFATAVREVHADRTPRQRMLDLVDPRQLLGPRQPRSRRRQARVTSVSLEPAEAS